MEINYTNIGIKIWKSNHTIPKAAMLGSSRISVDVDVDVTST